MNVGFSLSLHLSMQINLNQPKPEISVLILVEDESEAIFITNLLDDTTTCSFAAYHAGSIKTGKTLLKEKSIDIVLFDLSLPDSYGAHSFIQLFDDFTGHPFIILTSINDEAIAQNSVLKGAQDFLLKEEITTVVLNKSIHYAIQRKNMEKRMIAELIDTEDTVRRRIASDLHDGLGQNLTSASINLESLKSELIHWSVEKQQVFYQVLQSLQDSIAETRAIARNLMPKTVDEFGLVLSVESMINALKYTGIDFHFFNNLKGKRLALNVEVMIYRIIQEAVNNILKYANAEIVSIHLMKYQDNLILMVEDDGVGFSTSASEFTSGVGLTSIKNRVKSLSGNLIIDSSPGDGTTITIEIPKQKSYG